MKLLLMKHGLPEEGELLICKVAKIHFHSIFVNIIEYGRLQGMIHISEVSPGRIRNIRDYVKEGKTVVCKVLRINRERNHVDLSLRRVSDGQKRLKVNEIKQQQVAETIIEHVAKEAKKDVRPFFQKIYDNALEIYNSLFEAFYDVVENNLKLETLGIDKKDADALEEIIRQRIKPVSVEIKGHFDIQSYAPDGVEIIKKALKKTEKVEGNFTVSYKGAGVYNVHVIDKDYKKAEKVLANITGAVLDKIDSAETHGEFVRE